MKSMIKYIATSPKTNSLLLITQISISINFQSGSVPLNSNKS